MALVELEVSGPVATLRLNRTEKRNALNRALQEALQEQLDALRGHEPVRTLVLTANGPVFCAGADLTELSAQQGEGPEAHVEAARRLARLLETIYRYPKAVIARVNGHALGGGCGLAIACDFVLAAETASLGFTEVRVGFVPAVVSVFLRRKVTETVARNILLRGLHVSAPRAVEQGLIHRAVPEEELDQEVAGLAEEISRETGPSAVAWTKGLLADLAGMGLQEGLEHAVQLNALARQSDEFESGVAAFFDDRDPPWKDT